ncbi:hypothetical protein GJ629_15265 [Halapricum sp. CBA1109]|nr:hypothetical protein [Halapricum sp. CBA1109]
MPAAAERAASTAIDDAVVADAEAAATAATLDADRVVTLSRSGTVRRAIEALDPEAVLIAASHPGGEGVAVAGDLAATTDVTLTSDAGLAAAVDEFDPDAALVGADTVTADGALLNKVGTRGLALSADHEGVPLYAVTATAKVSGPGRPGVESARPRRGRARRRRDVRPAVRPDAGVAGGGLLHGGRYRRPGGYRLARAGVTVRPTGTGRRGRRPRGPHGRCRRPTTVRGRCRAERGVRGRVASRPGCTHRGASP